MQYRPRMRHAILTHVAARHYVALCIAHCNKASADLGLVSLTNLRIERLPDAAHRRCRDVQLVLRQLSGSREVLQC